MKNIHSTLLGPCVYATDCCENFMVAVFEFTQRLAAQSIYTFDTIKDQSIRNLWTKIDTLPDTTKEE